MASWQWQTVGERPYLTCALLADWQHGFFTQQFAPLNPFEITAMLYPQAAAYRAKQVHGNLVLCPSSLPLPVNNDNLMDGDGMMSEASQQAVWVCTADCTPVLIGDVATGQVAAVHAGWRGTAQKIVPVAIAQMQAQGSQLADLRVAMGPAILGSAYQVDHAVAIATAATIMPNGLDLSPETVIQQLLALDNSPVQPDPLAGKVRLDVRQVNRLQLEQLGLTAEQVAIAPHCTNADPVNFFSHRRAPLRKAQWSGIVSKTVA
ncbi:peptidoglycan editing factor PgeF [filamentous cyanobacterium LEGE 11480]|uniref:Purine nucleoside phosphorylase n=1 Tax=Romeriopsis navalis LEGE 11480 TaxID=2777977 RepID=A0A928VMC8_9CYAN|nr:peptidoglycan editing factor PgeF [Romeriopsis navalis]MBE9028494.1 peptidoglycan editing factor PgeF [Romeriopsis navalis LEGE 11480]